VRPEGLGKLKKSIHFIGFRAPTLPDCSIVRQPLRYRMSPETRLYVIQNAPLLHVSDPLEPLR
jgi:hypothetical protein